MAKDVIDSLENMKLTSEEEEVIALPDEGRKEEIEKVVQDTLRRAWGMDEGMHIVEVGSNLFQFKFKTEFELERVFEGGPWTFDNQVLLLRKWQLGMTAKNVRFDSISLWVQIWDASFDMVSPTVAAEIGSCMRVVEEVEKRHRQDGQNLFMRVKAAIPVAKPVRQGGFLAGLDGQKMMTTFKYERLPMFCHYCGLLGHDIKHCANYFMLTKSGKEVQL
uniref:DUF4283 domain-containing protein n=1 Tax=Quercus lobata TaxID=97700 RepID=A0A7N2KW36_QUELO